MFQVTGRLADRRRTVEWADGEVRGDAVAVEEIRLLVATARQLPLTPTGPMVTAALSPATVALRTITEVFDSGTVQLHGDVPTVPPPSLPNDAIP